MSSEIGEFRASEPVMTAKEAILEMRQDIKTLLAFQAVQQAANLPDRVVDLERFRWVLIGAAFGAGSGGGALVGMLFGAFGK